jgi:hypothetical protein
MGALLFTRLLEDGAVGALASGTADTSELSNA